MSDAPNPVQPASLRLIVLTSLLTGTLDISSAVLHHYLVGGRQPSRIFHFIASGVFGPRAIVGGEGYAALGLLFHYAIAFCFTSTLLVTYRHARLEKLQWWLLGILYGAFIWFVMNVLVVPHSNVGRWGYSFASFLLEGSILVVCIGLPTSYVAERFLSSRRKQPAV